MNVELLKKIRRHILRVPNRLRMNGWIRKGIPGETFSGDNGEPVKFAKCGTAACIAGWACILSGKPESAPGAI